MQKQNCTPKELLDKLIKIAKEAGYGKILNISIKQDRMGIITISDINYFNHTV